MNRKRVQIITALALSASGLGIAAHSAAQEDNFLDDSDIGRARSSITSLSPGARRSSLDSRKLKPRPCPLARSAAACPAPAHPCSR